MLSIRKKKFELQHPAPEFEMSKQHTWSQPPQKTLWSSQHHFKVDRRFLCKTLGETSLQCSWVIIFHWWISDNDDDDDYWCSKDLMLTLTKLELLLLQQPGMQSPPKKSHHAIHEIWDLLDGSSSKSSSSSHQTSPWNPMFPLSTPENVVKRRQ